MNNALIAIDVQNDFMAVPGSAFQSIKTAVQDTERLCKFIEKIPLKKIIASQDTHYVLDISHPTWWTNPDGSYVGDYTPISSADILNGKYTPRVDPKGSLAYVQALESQGEFKHFIWPEHCLTGTWGHNFLPLFSETINKWMASKMQWVNFVRKGENPMTEHFGIFRANVPNNDPSTQVNNPLFKTLETMDIIFLAGQAKSHCVVNSLKQLVEIAPQLCSKLVVLEDCMSDVPGLPSDFYDHVNRIYADAVAKGVRIQKSTDI